MTDNVLHFDGTFHRPEDTQIESEVAHRLGLVWKCELHTFGPLSPIDWYATRKGFMTGVLELKARTHTYGTYQTIYLSVRKWLCLYMASVGLNVPAIFVVKFTDRIAWVPLTDVDPRRMIIGGRGVVRVRNDIEPLIEVPIKLLRNVSC